MVSVAPPKTASCGCTSFSPSVTIFPYIEGPEVPRELPCPATIVPLFWLWEEGFDAGLIWPAPTTALLLLPASDGLPACSGGCRRATSAATNSVSINPLFFTGSPSAAVGSVPGVLITAAAKSPVRNILPSQCFSLFCLIIICLSLVISTTVILPKTRIFW